MPLSRRRAIGLAASASASAAGALSPAPASALFGLSPGGTDPALRRRLADETGATVFAHPGADLRVTEFMDWNCPYCRAAHGLLAELAMADPKIRMVYRDIAALGPQSEEAGRMMRQLQRSHGGGAWRQVHDIVMTSRRRADAGSVAAAIWEAGYDADLVALEAGRNAAALQAELRLNRALARDMGARGVPSWVLGDRLWDGDPEAAPMLRRIARIRERG